MTPRRRFTDLAQGLAAWGVLLVVVVGVPWLLGTGIGWPLWRTVPDISQIGTVLDRGLPERVFLSAVACVAWVVWFQFVVATAVEIVASVRGRRASRVPLVAAPIGQGAAHLVALALLVFSAMAMRPTTAAPELPPREAVVAPVDHVAPPVARLGSTPAVAEVSPEWVVARRDTLWRIAEETLGDGTRYGEILELNRNRPQSVGGVLTSASDRLVEGWVLRLPTDAVVGAATTQAATGERTWTVQPGDSLSRIAHRVLGSPDRWVEIFDANRGRTQPDGGTLVDPDVIEAGWVLQIPGAPTTVEVEAGDTLSGIAADQLGDASAWPELFEHNEGRPQADGGALVDPDEIEIGWQLDLPASDGDASAPEAADEVTDVEPTELAPVDAEPTDAEPTDTAPVDLEPVDLAPVDLDAAPIDDAPDADGVADAADATSDSADEVDLTPVDMDPDEPVVSPSSFPTEPLAGAAAAGLVLLARHLRSAHWRNRRPGERPMADPDPLGADLRSVARLDAPETVDRALRTLASDLVDVPPRLGVRCLVIRGDVVGVVLDRPLPAPPPGWLMDGNTLLLDKSIDQDLLDAMSAPGGRRGAFAAPALVPVGADPEGIGEVFFDLESVGVLGLTGPVDAVRAAHRWLAWGLLSAPWSETVDVVAVRAPVRAELPWVQSVETLDEALALAEARSALVAEAMAEAGCASTTSARMAHPDGPWRPLVVLADAVPAHGTPQAARLQALDRAGAGVAVLLPGMVAGLPTAVVDEHHVEYPGGISAATPRLAADHDAAIAAFLRPPTFAAVSTTRTYVGPAIDDAASASLRLLGGFSATRDGVDVTPADELARSLLAWLALHGGAGEEHRARVDLGADADDRWHAALAAAQAAVPLEVTDAGVLRLHEVNTDVDGFRRLVSQAGTESIDRLADALRLVRGPLLGDVTERPEWAHHHADYVRAEIEDAAGRVAEHFLAADAPLAAERAARRALRACPDSERLHLVVIEARVERDTDQFEASIDELYDSLADAGGVRLGMPGTETLARIDELRARHADRQVMAESAG